MQQNKTMMMTMTMIMVLLMEEKVGDRLLPQYHLRETVGNSYHQDPLNCLIPVCSKPGSSDCPQFSKFPSVLVMHSLCFSCQPQLVSVACNPGTLTHNSKCLPSTSLMLHIPPWPQHQPPHWYPCLWSSHCQIHSAQGPQLALPKTLIGPCCLPPNSEMLSPWPWSKAPIYHSSLLSWYSLSQPLSSRAPNYQLLPHIFYIFFNLSPSAHPISPALEYPFKGDHFIITL